MTAIQARGWVLSGVFFACCSIASCADEPTKETERAPDPDADTAVADAPAPEGGADTSTGGDAEPMVDAGEITTLKLANFSASAINGCVRSKIGTGAFTGPLFRAAGVPAGAVSERVSVERMNLDLKVIAAGGACSDPGLTTITMNLGTIAGSPVHRGAWYRGGTGSIGGGFAEILTVTPGKETIRAQDGTVREPSFVRDDDAGAPVDLTPIGGGSVTLDGDVVGKIVAASGSGAPIERRIKTKPGGTLSMWALSSTILLCDDSAPAKDGLTVCDPMLRAP